jgi:hypothetical protein
LQNARGTSAGIKSTRSEETPEQQTPWPPRRARARSTSPSSNIRAGSVTCCQRGRTDNIRFTRADTGSVAGGNTHGRSASGRETAG